MISTNFLRRATPFLLAGSLVQQISAQTPTAPPTSCYEASQPRIKETYGPKDPIQLTDAMRITAQNTKTVTFEVTQKWTNDDLEWIVPYYVELVNGVQNFICDRTFNVAYMEKLEYTVPCHPDGIAYIGLVMNDESFPTGEDLWLPEGCPEHSTDIAFKKIGYVLELPCVATCDHSMSPSASPSSEPTGLRGSNGGSGSATNGSATNGSVTDGSGTNGSAANGSDTSTNPGQSGADGSGASGSVANGSAANGSGTSTNPGLSGGDGTNETPVETNETPVVVDGVDAQSVPASGATTLMFNSQSAARGGIIMLVASSFMLFA